MKPPPVAPAWGLPPIPPLPSLDPGGRPAAASTPLGSRRQKLEAAGRALIDAWLRGDTDALGAWLADAVWVRWADGTFARHPKEPLLDALRRFPSAVPGLASVSGLASYTRAEAEHVVSPATVRSFGPLEPPWVTAAVETDEGRARVLVAAEPGPEPRFSNLPVVAPDGLARSVRRPIPRAPLGPAAKLVHADLVNHPAEVLALRGDLTTRLWWGGEVLTVDQIADRVGSRPDPELERAITEVRRSREPVPEALLKAATERSEELWGHRWPDLRPIWSEVEFVEMSRDGAIRAGRYRVLLLDLLDRDGAGSYRRRARAALLQRDPHPTGPLRR